MAGTDRDPADTTPRLIDHLVELRSRLLRAVAGLVLVTLVLLPFGNDLYAWLAAPLLAKLPAGGQLIAVEVASPFFAPVKLAFFAALMVSTPWLLYQAWAFVAPGLYRREKRLAVPLLASAVTLFYGGCAFAYFLVLPAVFGFLASVTPAQLRESRGYAVVGIFIIAAVITPPDVVSQLMLAIPMCLLYELGILAARWLQPRTPNPPR